MEIRSSFTNRSGELVLTHYRDIDSYEDTGEHPIKAVQAYCFHEGKLVVVYAENKGYWGPPGGGVEDGETAEAATVREILEETNMRVLHQMPLGTLIISASDGTYTHVRSMCVVEPIGPFIGDPDGDVTEIQLVEAESLKDYFDWGEPGEHQLKRALDLYEKYIKE